MHGFGTFLWTSGQRYDGEWKDGRRDGIGVKVYADGETNWAHSTSQVMSPLIWILNCLVPHLVFDSFMRRAFSFMCSIVLSN